jgi:quinol-cytochrome oxidoreductase complex cytochrome b subunit
LFNLSYFIDRFLFFTGATTFKWVNGVATLLLLLSVLMAVSGELICIWYATSVTDVKASLLFLKYNTRIGDLLVRGHKLMIATAFVAVFLHMGKAYSFGVFYGSRSSS